MTVWLVVYLTSTRFCWLCIWAMLIKSNPCLPSGRHTGFYRKINIVATIIKPVPGFWSFGMYALLLKSNSYRVLYENSTAYSSSSNERSMRSIIVAMQYGIAPATRYGLVFNRNMAKCCTQPGTGCIKVELIKHPNSLITNVVTRMKSFLCLLYLKQKSNGRTTPNSHR